MTESEIEKCRKRLEQFLADLLEPLGRRERRHWSSVYVRGLLLDGERKSIEPMAAGLAEGNVHTWQDRELPSGGELASSGIRRKYDSGLATVLAGKLDWRRRAPGRSGPAGDRGVPDQVAEHPRRAQEKPP